MGSMVDIVGTVVVTVVVSLADVDVANILLVESGESVGDF